MWRGTEILAPPEVDPRTDQPVANGFTDPHVLTVHFLKGSILRNNTDVSGVTQIQAACKIRFSTIQAMCV